MSIRQRVALVLASLALVVVAGCTQPAPGASGPPLRSLEGVPATDPAPGSSQPVPSKGRGDY